jgi:creatinine amidohydrolase
MTWTDVRDYLKRTDMVIIPLGSTEQHGPGLPLGSDYYDAVDISKQISAKTGVVVAPILWVGYSEYHSGFPGTLSISSETMEKVLFEVVESMIKHGFRRILFFNSHGGNGIAQDLLIHRINHETPAVAIAIGLGGPVQKQEDTDSLDYHAGLEETSTMLCLEPSMVKMEKVAKPTMHFSGEVEKLMALSKNKPQLGYVWDLLLGVPAVTKKLGASDELSSNGIWTLKDPRAANTVIGQKVIQRTVEQAVNFINAWKSYRP